MQSQCCKPFVKKRMNNPQTLDFTQVLFIYKFPWLKSRFPRSADIKKYLLLAAGFTTLSLAITGIFLPLLPTTPFLLLSAACFLRSSKSLYNRLVTHKVLGKYIGNYIKYHAVSIRAKIISIVLLWIVIGSSMIFVTKSILIRVVFATIAVLVTIHLLRMKTLTREMSTGYEE
jgi:uncharacterized membrane protein YbaN (DUF454 family)